MDIGSRYEVLEGLLPQFTTLSVVRKSLDTDDKIVAIVRFGGFRCRAFFSWEATMELARSISALRPCDYKVLMPQRVQEVCRKEGLEDMMEAHGDIACAVFFLKLG